MHRNVGVSDRVLRIIIGILLIAYAAFPSTGWDWIGWIGVIPILTAVFGICPIYSLLGISSCSTKPTHRTAD